MTRDSIRAGRGKTFYDRLADGPDKEGFGDFVRELCAPYYHAEAGGRPPIDPEVYDIIHKVENAVDLSSGAILSCEIQSATKADSTSMAAHIETAGDMVDHVVG